MMYLFYGLDFHPISVPLLSSRSGTALWGPSAVLLMLALPTWLQTCICIANKIGTAPYAPIVRIVSKMETWPPHPTLGFEQCSLAKLRDVLGHIPVAHCSLITWKQTRTATFKHAWHTRCEPCHDIYFPILVGRDGPRRACFGAADLDGGNAYLQAATERFRQNKSYTASFKFPAVLFENHPLVDANSALMRSCSRCGSYNWHAHVEDTQHAERKCLILPSLRNVR